MGKNLFLYRHNARQCVDFVITEGVCRRVLVVREHHNLPLLRGLSNLRGYLRIERNVRDWEKEEDILVKGRRCTGEFLAERNPWEDKVISAYGEIRSWKRTTKRRHQYR